jgi:hypothetical protein
MVDAVDTKIAYATEVYDYNNNFATGTYTAPVNGVYNFGAYFLLGTVATLVTLYCAIYVNGATYKRGIRLDTTFGNNNGACVVADIPLNAGDTVEFYGYQNSAGNEACNADAKYTYCFGHLIHAT